MTPITYLEEMKAGKLSESFGTVSQTINGLAQAGYTFDFNIHEECLVCHQESVALSPEEFQIDKVYRFEGASNPDDESIVYAISSPKFGVKGVLVNGYGISADQASSELIERLQTIQTKSTMENKSNDATPQRPEGARVLNAELVEMNLQKYIDQIKGETTWHESGRNSVTIFKSETMRIVLIGLHQDAELKPHGMISVQVLEGKINFITDQKTALVESGQMIALQENVTHSVVALTDSFFLLTLAMNKQ